MGQLLHHTAVVFEDEGLLDISHEHYDNNDPATPGIRPQHKANGGQNPQPPDGPWR